MEKDVEIQIAVRREFANTHTLAEVAAAARKEFDTQLGWKLSRLDDASVERASQSELE